MQNSSSHNKTPKQLRLDLNPKPKPLTSSDVWLLISKGDKQFNKSDFFKWIRDRDKVRFDQAYTKGYKEGENAGYSYGRHAPRPVRDNY